MLLFVSRHPRRIGLHNHIDYKSSYGLRASVIDPNAHTTSMEYGNPGRPSEVTKIVDPLLHETLMAYDSLGKVENVTNSLGRAVSYTYDINGRVKTVQDADGEITEYAYDAKGNLISVKDPKQRIIQYEYDTRDRLKKMTDQLLRYEGYTYDTSDNLKTFTDRRGQVTTNTSYDLMNRVKKITYHDGSFTDYTYDKAGRVDYINDSISGYIDYTYNDFGCTTCSGRGMDRIAQEKTALGTIDYTYDKVGRRITMTVAGEPVVNYGYDDAGRMTGISRNIGGSVRTYTFSPDNAGLRQTLRVPLLLPNQYINATYDYDPANRVLSMLYQSPSAQIENLLYEYDEIGNRSKFTRDAVQTTRNAVSGASYNDANHMLTFLPETGSPKNMTYDNNGNLLTVSNGCGTTTFTWSARNKLTAINGYNSDCSALTASFKYDATGRRIEKTINGITTQYLYDGLDIIQEIRGVSKTNYIRTLNIDEPLTRIKADGTIRHYVLDALGSVIALTDDSGIVKTNYSYDPFGNVTAAGEVSDNPFQYTGRENDGTGLCYYRARYYSPDLQRFISEDPIGLEGGDTDFYLYVSNNPVNVTDPSGTGPLLFGACIVLTLGDAIGTGWELAQALSLIEELRKEKSKLADQCQDPSLASKQLERYRERINEIDKEIIRLSRSVNRSGLIGVAKGFGLTILCGLALTP